MSYDAYIGDIMIVPFRFTPHGWLPCDGRLLEIARYSALYSLLGNTYGGDGKATFALPDLRGRAPLHAGNGAGLSPRRLGEAKGEEAHTLSQSEMARHRHEVRANDVPATPTMSYAAVPSRAAGPDEKIYAPSGAGNVAMSPVAVAPAGYGFPHNNMQPYLVLNFVICVEGAFPTRP